jgi:death-on-curing family protein
MFMLIPINEELITIIHYYVVTRLIAEEGIVYSGTIRGCVDKAFTALYGQKRYQTIESQAGSLLYSIVHGHSFTDGNKRTGLLTTCLFLLLNGKFLSLPKDCTQYLERMADAKNPNAPTEADAIDCVRKNSASNFFSTFMNVICSFYLRTQGHGYLPQLTRTILDQDILPSIRREELIDRNLLERRIRKWKERVACANGTDNK